VECFGKGIFMGVAHLKPHCETNVLQITLCFKCAHNFKSHACLPAHRHDENGNKKSKDVISKQRPPSTRFYWNSKPVSELDSDMSYLLLLQSSF
jgi:hypothetical protein